MKMLKYIIVLLALSISCYSQTITSAPPFTIQMAILQETNIYPYANGTNFVVNYNITNSRGFFIYHSVLATNNVFFTGVSNEVRSRVVTISVYAFGGNRRIGLATNTFFRVNTNQMPIVGAYYEATLTNGNEFYLTVRSNNNTRTTLCHFYGQ